MKIEHIAIWTNKLEEMKAFYEKYFNGKSNQKYINPTKKFESYFITFEDGARIELMQNPEIAAKSAQKTPSGYAHIAISLDSKEKVDKIAQTLKADGYEIQSGPRVTGDGYYECCFSDPDKNSVEITI